MSPPSKRTLILDFDGVVVETEPLHFASWNAVFDELLGIRLAGDYHQIVGLSLTQIFDLWTHSDGQQIHLSESQKSDLLARKTERFFELGRKTLKPMPGLLPLASVARQQGWMLAIASRALRTRLQGTLEILDLPITFDQIMGSEDIVDPTTDRKVHALAAYATDAHPADSVVIEDSVSGIADARACGIGHVVGFTSSLRAAALFSAGAHHVVSDLEEIAPLLQELIASYHHKES